MAILGSDTLSGCSSIPSFLGGSADTPSNPSVTIFRNTSAPTSWVKKTTENNKALRVIGGPNGTSLSPGGSSSFTTILTSSKAFPGSLTATTSGIGNAALAPSNFPQSPGTFGASTGGFSPTSPTDPGHSHPQVFWGPTLNSAGPLVFTTLAAATTSPPTGSGGPGGPHSHSLTVDSHGHAVIDGGHSHSFSSESPHTHPFSGTAQDFAVTYVDIIIATKS